MGKSTATTSGGTTTQEKYGAHWKNYVHLSCTTMPQILAAPLFEPYKSAQKNAANPQHQLPFLLHAAKLLWKVSSCSCCCCLAFPKQLHWMSGPSWLYLAPGVVLLECYKFTVLYGLTVRMALRILFNISMPGSSSRCNIASNIAVKKLSYKSASPIQILTVSWTH